MAERIPMAPMLRRRPRVEKMLVSVAVEELEAAGHSASSSMGGSCRNMVVCFALGVVGYFATAALVDSV